VARGATPTQARTNAYAGVQDVSFRGMHFRRDIGAAWLRGKRV
jgi:phosphoribosylamine-glycine ligase